MRRRRAGREAGQHAALDEPQRLGTGRVDRDLLRRLRAEVAPEGDDAVLGRRAVAVRPLEQAVPGDRGGQGAPRGSAEADDLEAFLNAALEQRLQRPRDERALASASLTCDRDPSAAHGCHRMCGLPGPASMNANLGHCLIECCPVILAPFRTAPALLVAACALLGAGCKKGKESLVLANLKLERPDARAVNLNGVTLTAMPGPTETYPLSMLSADDFAEFGLYLPENVTGEVAIVASAVPQERLRRLPGQQHRHHRAGGSDRTRRHHHGGRQHLHRGRRRHHGRRRQRWRGRRRRGHRRAATAGIGGTTGAAGTGGGTAGTGSGGGGGSGGSGGSMGTGGMAGYPSIIGLPDVPARRQQRLRERAGQGRRDLAERPAGRDRRRRRCGSRSGTSTAAR